MLPSRNADRAKPVAGKTTWPNLQLLKTISDSNTLNHTVFTQGKKKPGKNAGLARGAANVAHSSRSRSFVRSFVRSVFA